MTARLRLLDRVTWDDRVIPGDRPAALLALLAAHPAGLGDDRIVEEVWRGDPPEKPTKALQVLVSRLRSIDRSLVERHDRGYRLGLPRAAVDVWLLDELVDGAEQAWRSGTAEQAEPAARAATEVAVGDRGSGPLADLRADASHRVHAAERVLALSLAGTARHTEALPRLQALAATTPDDPEVLVALLRAEATVHGVPAALERYEVYRRDVADRLGVDPDPAVRRTHRELLAADDPRRTGVRFDAEELLGREEDLRRLRAALATGRLTTVLGPGGIGKTRIAHVLAREATQPRVHVVELVGLGSGDDVVAEVGAALGIRGSVTARHSLTPAQQADVRGRIAQELDSSPALLVLDNCEHLLEAIAGLVAFLLATTRDLSILTTSRAPLRIAAERVVPLTQLAPDHCADLFVRRAQAVRPGVALDPGTIEAVVARLDGLPLAVELAAARARTMSVEQIRAALDDRFGLLRSRDRGAPERHRTLTAVIEWSWDLLTEDERVAAARMSVFHDGFDAGSATAVVGPDGMDRVEALADQSIVTVEEIGGATRFRMLETVREFAGLRLLEHGDHEVALEAQTTWALDLVAAVGSVFFSPDQYATVDALLVEENNLTDVLRRALLGGDTGTVARLMATLSSLWTMTGNHARIFALADATQNVLADWDPRDDTERSAAFETAGLLLIHLSWIRGRDTSDLRQAMLRWGPSRDPMALAAHAMFVEGEGGDVASRVVELTADEPDPGRVAMLLLWAAISAENVGDVAAAVAHSRQALAQDGLTPYLEASLHTELSQLAMYVGDHHVAAHHAELAWPVLLRLHANDDASSMRFTSVVSRLLDGDVDGAAALMDEIGELPDGGQLGSRMVLHAARAELALARGETQDGFAHYERALVEVMVDIPGWTGGPTPWVSIAAGAGLTARVHHGPPGPDPRADELRDLLLGASARSSGGSTTSAPMDDLPLSGVMLVAIGAWGLRFGDPALTDDAVRLLAIARRWNYNRTLPSLAWEPLVALADEVRPGLLGQLLQEYGARPGPDLVPDASELLRRFTSSG
ncbi:BTAD domain-containing putative transcriptional regulator [Phycicoccus sp. Root101]|uniref:ATP-binding protein n=1 Tax=Phycicoccus sp. Root101 TaxID=1736421 RepID=UPI0007032AAD|nr:BTAD domain-containing putative transcriptional regulator [Phycicoccus sp. Root101]KQU67532.1 hypothetical protein ASC58_13360 [Phycicoccus sp. Root101]